MKLISFKHAGLESWGAVSGDRVCDLAAATGCATLADFIASPSYGDREAIVAVAQAGPLLSEVVLLPPIPRPEKIVCAVRNYMDHHQEALASGLQRELSDFPPIFLRVWRSQVAHNQPIVRPRVSDSLDWEGELAVIIGVGGRDIPEADVWNHVAGYSCYNDASVREWQFHAKQIASGKNFENTGAFGPWLVTADELPPGARGLRIETRLNGQTVQSANTSDMVFDVAALIVLISEAITLEAGDLIIAGTPSGIGHAREPRLYMHPGDVCEVEIERIGLLRNPIQASA